MNTVRLGVSIIGFATALFGQSWTALSPAGNPPAPREGHSAVFDPNTARMFVFGGQGFAGNFNDTWMLNTSGNLVWAPVNPSGNPPPPRSGHSAIYDAKNVRMVVFGGAGSGNTPCLNDAWLLNNPNAGANALWTPVQTTRVVPAPRSYHSAVFDPGANRMIVFGGFDCFSQSFLNDVWVLANIGIPGALASWTQMQTTGTPPPPRQGHAAIYDAATNRMFVFGGLGSGTTFNDVWVLNNANGSGGTPNWSPLSPTGTPPSPRSNASVVFDSANRMIVFGGNNGTLIMNDTFALSGLTNLFAAPAWTQLPAANGPSKAAASGVYDAGSNRTIVFGGRRPNVDFAPTNDTWALSLNQSVSITTTTLPNGTVGVAYSTQLAATGGSPPYQNWQVAGGALPPGLALNAATGVISGTPTTATGSPFTIRVTVQDSANNTSPAQSLSITIGGGTTGVTIATTTLPAGSVGTAYGVRLTASNGTPPYSNWQVVAGALPPGLTLDAPSGAIGGTPTTAAGSPFTFRVTVNDSAGSTSPPQSLTIAIVQGITITPTTLPGGTVGVPYSVQLIASNGTPPYSNWVLTSGSLPAGLTLNAATGVISGTPTAATGGPFFFNVTVKDSAGASASPQMLSIVIGQGVVVTTTSMPNGSVSGPYSVQLTAAGGNPPYSNWTVSSGTLPAGVLLSPFSGVISGIPLNAAGSPFSFSVTVRDSNGSTSPPQTLSIVIFPRVNVTTTALPNAAVGAAYSATLAAADGIPPYSNWQVASGSFPSNLILNASTGAISGTPTSAAGGPFSFNVTVKDSAGGTSVPQTLTISFGPAPSLTATPSTVAFSYRLGDSAPTPQSISLFSGSTPMSFSISTRSDQNFLVATPSSGQTPAAITLSVNIAGLRAATLNGQAIVTGSSGSVTVDVTLTVIAPAGPQLEISPAQFSLTATPGAPAGHLQLAVFNTGGGTLNFGVRARTLSGGNWVALDANGGSATFGAPAGVGITLNTAPLAANTYSAEITVTDLSSNQTQMATVLLAVNGRSLSIQLSQSGLEFAATTSGAVGPARTFAISNAGQGQMSWSLTTQTLSGGTGWLIATPAAGVSAAGAATPPLVTVSINPAGVPVGRHYGSVRVVAPGAANSPQVVSVLLNVFDAALGTAPVLSDNGALIVGENGTPTALPPPISIANLSGRPLTYVSTRSTEDGRDWVKLSPASGTLALDRPTDITIQPDFAGLPPGVRHGTLRLGFSDGSVHTLRVTSVVPSTTSTAVIRSKEGERDAANCTPKALVPHFNAPESGFSVAVSAPVSVRAAVTDDCGTPLQTGGVFFRASNDSSKSIPLVHAGNGIWTGTWVPGTVETAVSLVVTAFTAGNSPIGGQTPLLAGNIRSAPASSARPNAVYNAASFQAGDQVTVGSWASVFGDRMAEGEALAPDAPYGPQLLTTEVRLGDVPVPLLYVNETQVNALIPHGLAPNTQHQIVVQRGNTLSVPVQVTVSEVQPGIYTVNQQGTGQGAIQIANTTILVAPAADGARPARRGEIITIYCSGLGAVTIAPDDGVPVPLAPLSFTLATPAVTIGGVPAEVSFSGLAPSLVGVYQVNAVIPNGAPSGNAVPLVITVNEIASNRVTVAVE